MSCIDVKYILRKLNKELLCRSPLRFLAVLESHRTSLMQQRTDIEAQLTELQLFEKKIRKQLKRR